MKMAFCMPTCSSHDLLHNLLDRPFCHQCVSGHRQYECQWDPAPLSKTEKLEARVRELEELVESNWGHRLEDESLDNIVLSQDGEGLNACLRLMHDHSSYLVRLKRHQGVQCSLPTMRQSSICKNGCVFYMRSRLSLTCL